jgi:hypothetical protein
MAAINFAAVLAGGKTTRSRRFICSCSCSGDITTSVDYHHPTPEFTSNHTTWNCHLDSVPFMPQKPIGEMSDCWKIGIDDSDSCEQRCEDLSFDSQIQSGCCAYDYIFDVNESSDRERSTSTCWCGNEPVCQGKMYKPPASTSTSPSPSGSDDSSHSSRFSTGMVVFLTTVSAFVSVALVYVAVQAVRRHRTTFSPRAAEDYTSLTAGVV